MTANDLLNHIYSLGLRVSVQGDNLQVLAPKGALTEQLRSELAERKVELIALLRKRSPISRRSHSEAPLSFAQQRLWFLEQLQPGMRAYNISGAVRLRGQLYSGALDRALGTIVARHEALRTTFRLVNNAPVQVVGSQKGVTLRHVNLAGLSAKTREGAMMADVLAEMRRPFDLATGPLLRPILFCLNPDDHVLLVCMHHIISDGWSLGILVRELSRCYEAFIKEQQPVLPELPIQYMDYSEWQREHLQGAVLEHDLEYWRNKLGGLPTLELPTDRPRPAVPSFAGAQHRFTVPSAIVEQLRGNSRREGATLFMSLLTALGVLLARYANQQDIIVGSPVAGRTRPESEGLIGFFANTLVLRVDLAGDPSFRELLQRVRETCLDAYTHQDVPFEKLVEVLRPERDLSRNPLFQVLFSLQNLPHEALELTGLTLEPVEFDRGVAQFDLAVSVREADEGLEGLWEYSADLFAPETVVRMAEHFQRILEVIAADPETRIWALPIVTADEWLGIRGWNATERPYPQSCVHELVTAQALRSPGCVAVVFAHASLTYRELEERAERLAGYLRTLGIGPDIPVGIFLERSLEMMIGLLGVLKAGGAYVPLDPAYPAERLAYMIEDSGVSVLVSQRALAERLPTRTVRTVFLDDPSEEWVAAVGPAATLENLAYIIYTSGSTGKPKGVSITHRALVNLLASMGQEPGLTAQDVLLSVTTLSFDIAGLELFLPLITGARVVVATREQVADGSELQAVLASAGVTVMQATPATWRLLLEAGWGGTPGLKVLCGGEALLQDLATALLSRTKEVWNVYGPTETTIWSSAWKVEGRDGPISIGRPIANTQMYVCDPRGSLQPIGVIGELYIGGHGVARGYWNRPDLTAERFVPDPFSKTPGARLYRTGDLARWRSDGTIECLGRIDHQVKIRGYRIELDEIEIALARYPGLRQAVVVARQDGSGERQLVAYLTTNEGGVSLATSDLRAFLAKGLPDYMVPSLFTVLSAFPLTPNGKVDHRALASLNLSPPVERRESALPRDPLEAAIAQIWEEILGCGSVGIDDDFFDLGGHSLLAVRMIERVEQVCGPRLPVSTLFAGATIRHLAGALLEQNRESIRGLLAPIQDGGSRPPFFFLHGDLAGAGVYCRALAREIGPEQPFYVFHPQGLDGGSVPLTIEAMADEYLRTLRAFRPAGPYLLGGFCNGGLVAFEMARRLRAQGERVDFLLVFDSRGENARFRWLELLTKFLATVFRRPLGDRQRLFLTLRALTLAIERNLAVLRSHPLVVLRKAYRRWRGDQPTPRPVSSNNLFAAYGRAVFSYVPQRYSGRVALFLSMGAAEAGYDRDWRRVATELDVHVLPGNHTTVVTQHVQIVARCLRECLDAAQGHDAPGAKSKAAQPG